MKDSRKDFIKQAHDAACSKWKKNIEDEFPKLFKQDALVAGKYYKLLHRDGSFIVSNFNGDLNANQYGFTSTGEWSNHLGTAWFNSKSGTTNLMTEKEVGDALIKEAKKIGFKKGVKFIDVVDGELEVVDGNVYEYYPNMDILTLNCDRIYKNGKWAKILETITKEQAEKELGKVITD
jgi:hypothetical protein